MNQPWTVRQLSAIDEEQIDGLADVLIDCVAGGASVSFMQPFTREKAVAFWRRVADGVADGRRALLVAEDVQGICGTVQLIFDLPENQPHRADLAKMLVHRRARRQGLGAALMQAAETTALQCGKSLLVLDTVAGCDAARLYERLGWVRVGDVPNFALMPDGTPCGTTFFYRALPDDGCQGVPTSVTSPQRRQRMTNKCLATNWGSVDRCVEPTAFIDYLDVVSSLETIQRIRQRTYDLLQVREGHQLLDVGCGVGDDVRALAQRVGTAGLVVGIDCSEIMLAEARKRLSGLTVPFKLCVGDATKLEFAANTFDGCRAERVLVHLTDAEQALAEMVRVVRPGGRIVVFDVDWETLVVDAPDRAITRRILNFLCDGSGSRWVGRQLRRLFVEAGLTGVGVTAETLVFTDYIQADRVFQLQEYAAQAQAAKVISSAQANKWLNDLEQASERGSFFAAATGFCVSGRNPD